MLSCIYDDNTNNYKQILAQRTNREEADADFLRGIKKRNLAADSILGDVTERTDKDPCEDGEEHCIVEEGGACLHEPSDEREVEHWPV